MGPSMSWWLSGAAAAGVTLCGVPHTPPPAELLSSNAV